MESAFFYQEILFCSPSFPSYAGRGFQAASAFLNPAPPPRGWETSLSTLTISHHRFAKAHRDSFISQRFSPTSAPLGSQWSFSIVQLQRLAPRVISRTSTEIRISFELRLMLVGAFKPLPLFVLPCPFFSYFLLKEEWTWIRDVWLRLD
ncbi:hypothetical protein DFR59_10163 [Falsibacillus pallidus]|uniref:Uncharacterized protein n=1 Tax=Falsibacillus pallidus TaxID=493781 RepID=A0A370GUQ3_9BACI|nr:hypothetical protein DFR59_10163 [Falsibacillus pallidus]